MFSNREESNSRWILRIDLLPEKSDICFEYSSEISSLNPTHRNSMDTPIGNESLSGLFSARAKDHGFFIIIEYRVRSKNSGASFCITPIHRCW